MSVRTGVFGVLVFMVLVITGVLAGGISTSAYAQDDGRTKIINPSSVVGEQEDQTFIFTTRAGFYSEYIYRGLALYEGTSIQPSGGVFMNLGKLGTLGVSTWMQIPAEDDQVVVTASNPNDGTILDSFKTEQKFFELDTTFSYDYTFDFVTLSAGHIWYTDPGYGKNTAIVGGEELTLPEVAPDTSEIYAGFSLDVPLHPTFTWYRDYRTILYNYFSLEFSQAVDIPSLGEGFAVTPFVNFGFADGDIYARNGLEHVNVGLASEIPWGVFTVKPSFVYVFEADGTSETRGDRAQDNFVFGVDLSYDFGV